VAVSWSDSGARTGPHEIGLIAKIAARNDDDAARRLYRKYRMELFRFGAHVLHDQGLAEEMVQETFIRFCQRARSYDAGRGPVRGWLFTMAKSAAIDIARRPSFRPFLPVEDFQLPPQYDTVDQALTVFIVDQTLDKLPVIYSDVMRQVRDDHTQSEIADRRQCSIGRCSWPASCPRSPSAATCWPTSKPTTWQRCRSFTVWPSMRGGYGRPGPADPG